MFSPQKKLLTWCNSFSCFFLMPMQGTLSPCFHCLHCTRIWSFVFLCFFFRVFFSLQGAYVKISFCRQFVAHSQSEVCKACRFWACKGRDSHWNDDGRNWDIQMDGTRGLDPYFAEIILEAGYWSFCVHFSCWPYTIFMISNKILV